MHGLTYPNKDFPRPDPLKRGTGAFCVQPACIGPSFVYIQPACFLPQIFPQKNKKKTHKHSADSGQQASTLPELLAEQTSTCSMSFVGTHEYLAPEIIKGDCQGSAVWIGGHLVFSCMSFCMERLHSKDQAIVQHYLVLLDSG